MRCIAVHWHRYFGFTGRHRPWRLAFVSCCFRNRRCLECGILLAANRMQESYCSTINSDAPWYIIYLLANCFRRFVRIPPSKYNKKFRHNNSKNLYVKLNSFRPSHAVFKVYFFYIHASDENILQPHITALHY